MGLHQLNPLHRAVSLIPGVVAQGGKDIAGVSQGRIIADMNLAPGIVRVDAEGHPLARKASRSILPCPLAKGS